MELSFSPDDLSLGGGEPSQAGEVISVRDGGMGKGENIIIELTLSEKFSFSSDDLSLGGSERSQTGKVVGVRAGGYGR